MNANAQPKRIRHRRLSEIQAAHSLLRRVFTDSEQETAEFAKALDFAKNAEGIEVSPSATVVRRLIRWYGSHNKAVVCRVLDAGAFSGGLLWLQTALGRIVEEIGRDKPAIVMVTGLREAVRSPARRWSRKAEQERLESVQLIEESVHRSALSRGVKISLFIS
jgi:hypothetical protein